MPARKRRKRLQKSTVMIDDFVDSMRRDYKRELKKRKRLAIHHVRRKKAG